ncbi:DUF1572 family protein [Fontivita pretiosa]|uniref:DUF1572 family protein n=1 Tax=Fontivita pretiosa TaxID=2989684 RepID=UPI003D18123F
MSTLTRQSTSVIAASIEVFRSQKALAEGAIAQTSDEDLRKPLDANTNSIAVIMKHMAGNMISRWTDFLTSDGEKPDRDRDGEFIDDFPDRAAILAYWERGWRCTFDALGALSDAELYKTITIRGEPHHVIDAIQRQISHYGYHVGQIVLIARVLKGEREWNVLTIARGRSRQYNEQVGYRA